MQTFKKEGNGPTPGDPVGSPRANATTSAIVRHWQQAGADDRLAHLIRDAARGMTRCLQWRLAEHGVSFGHWMFLRILWEGDGLSQRALSEQAGLMESTTHSALVRMEQAGYIERRGLPGNRRRIHVFLTNSGRALEKKLVPLAEEVNAEALGGTSAQDIATTRRTLLSIVIRLAEDEQRALAAGRSIPANRALGNQPES